MSTDDLPNGAVLDEPMARALLYSAVREHLLDDDPIIGDGFVRHLMSAPPREHLIANAFEHLVLSGRILVPFWFPGEWKGELVERGLVVPTDAGVDDDLVEAPGLSPSLVLAMLRDRGHTWSHKELVERYDIFMSAYRTWEAMGGKSFEALEIRNILRKIIPISPDEYSSEELAAWNAVSEAYTALKPVIGCHQAYRRVLTSSLQNAALSALPLDAAAVSAGELPLIDTSAERIVLLRVACKQLQRVPIGGTLRETIAVALSPEAQGLRHKLTDWTETIRANQADPTAVVLEDIGKARKSLKTAKTLTRLGEYSTIIGVPAGVAGLFVAGPLVAVAGIVVSILGGVALGGQKYIERMNRWAMYGQQ